MGWVLSVHGEDANNPAHVSEELKRLVHNFLAAARAQGHRVKAADLASTVSVQLGASPDAPAPSVPAASAAPPTVEPELPPEASPSPVEP